MYIAVLSNVHTENYTLLKARIYTVRYKLLGWQPSAFLPECCWPIFLAPITAWLAQSLQDCEGAVHNNAPLHPITMTTGHVPTDLELKNAIQHSVRRDRVLMAVEESQNSAFLEVCLLPNMPNHPTILRRPMIIHSSEGTSSKGPCGPPTVCFDNSSNAAKTVRQCSKVFSIWMIWHSSSSLEDCPL